jgi:hypothetical protein
MLDLYLSQHLGKLYSLIRSKALVQVGQISAVMQAFSLCHGMSYVV